jgi:hypothetical protein
MELLSNCDWIHTILALSIINHHRTDHVGGALVVRPGLKGFTHGRFWNQRIVQPCSAPP